jgi:hypothetical protein
MTERLPPIEIFTTGEFSKDALDALSAGHATSSPKIIVEDVSLVNDMISGKRAVTPEIADDFSDALGTTFLITVITVNDYGDSALNYLSMRVATVHLTVWASLRDSGLPGDLPVGRLVDRRVESHFKKYFASPVGQIISTNSRHPTPQQGRIAIVTDAGWDAVDAAAFCARRDRRAGR